MAVIPYLQSHLQSMVKTFGMTGDLLTYGRQDVYTAGDFIERCASATGLALQDVPADVAASLEKSNPIHPTQYPTPYPIDQINDQVYFRRLGFKSITSIDASGFEGCTRVFDMNRHGAPEDLREAFDVSLNIGTMEHVFNVANFLLNDFQMLRVGGTGFHFCPMNNWGNHGFWQIQPCLLNDFYEQNRWDILQRSVFRITGGHWGTNDQLEVCSCDREQFTKGWGKLDAEYYFSGIVVRKTAESTGDVPAQQGLYVQQWK